MKEKNQMLCLRVSPALKRILEQDADRRFRELQMKSNVESYTLSEHIRYLVIRGIEASKIKTYEH
jgi:hypothetical protein